MPATDSAVDSAVQFKSPLHKMTQTTATCLWNDSASIDELSYSISHGGVGATCNPSIAVTVLKQEMAVWKPRIKELASQMPEATEDEISWRIVEEISANAAKLLLPIFEREKGRNGRLSIQTDPRNYRNAQAMVEQALHFNQLAPNMIVKIAATRAGIAAIEEVTYRGISINATVSFTVPQTIAVAEAVERGLKRREAEGLDIATMGPVCTIMVGRLDDWLKVLHDKHRLSVDPGYMEWAGVAVFKKAYRIYRERGYRLRLLSAAFRNHMHWSELIGGNVVISPPCSWQKRYNESDIEVVPRIDTPVDAKIVDTLLNKFPDFERAYAEDGMTTAEFDNFGSTRRTLRQFIAACAEMNAMVRDVILPNPDTE
ncbi:MAG TPA: transaldolase family protein [Terracidiphilus sp.]|jgi:transaldolase|nr:transaldolase family protein [Terracidiphilus sp.]